MRKIVPECRALDSTPIQEMVLDPRMRDDRSAVLKGLQCVYCKAESRAALFTILETHFQPGTRRDVGRPGMDLWRVIVFAIVKQCLDLDYDALLYRANKIICCGSCWGMARLGLMRRSTAGSAWWTPCSI